MRGKVINGSVNGLAEALAPYEGQVVSVKIKLADKITDEQRAYWFGVIVHSFKRHLIETGEIVGDEMAAKKLKEALHLVLKMRLGFTENIAGVNIPKSMSDRAEEEKREISMLIDMAHAYFMENGIPIIDGRR